MKRSAGVLLSITSLPSKYGIGCFSKSAYEFIDYLKKANQLYWQILPLGPTSYGDSPYQSFSTFAGNPYFIDLEKLGLDSQELDALDWGDDAQYVDYEKIYNNRYAMLQKAFGASDIANVPAFQQFCEENEPWLNDYALFMAVKERFGGISWNEWDEDIRLRRPEAMERYEQELAESILFQKFMQYHFSVQWDELKAYANKQGIQIIGDIPIYVAFDSADTWANPGLFQLDEDNLPVAVAGCPPDGFSATGQLWGNPLYRWDYHEETGYAWWIKRLSKCFKIYDVVRVDHFRGFDEYYSIPYGDDTAVNGHWEQGPGMKLFTAVKEALGEKEIIAEDLGYVTDTVRQLVKDSGFPNMKVLEFAFDSRDTGSAHDYLPHNYDTNCVAYTGTHDNQTIVSWFQTISDEERALARNYLCDWYTPDEELNLSFISRLMQSNANGCIIPMQDWLGLDDSTRMNTPSTLGANWKWRLREEDMSEALCEIIKMMTKTYGR